MLALSRRTLLAAPLALVLAPRGAAAQTTIPVVATFSILADLVRAVGGERLSITSLVGPDGDAHVYTPKPDDAKAVAAARLVFVNGLGFEGWIDRLVAASATKAPRIVATRDVKPIAAKDEHDHDHGHDHGKTDPHAWQSVPNAKLYVAAIRDGLVAADPDGKATYEANASAYLAKLDVLDAEIRAAFAKVPPAERRIIASHDAFGYYTAAYGVKFIAPSGVSTESEPSAKDVARIIREVKRLKIKAVFMENITDTRLIERIAKETGAKIGGRLYSDALSGPGGPAATYLDMMRHNLSMLTAALTA